MAQVCTVAPLISNDDNNMGCIVKSENAYIFFMTSYDFLLASTIYYK